MRRDGVSMRRRFPAVMVFALLACSTTPASTDAVAPEDVVAKDTTVTDAGPGKLDEHGFSIRVPQKHVFDIDAPDGTKTTQEMSDVDHVCTLEFEDTHAFIYLRATPTACEAWKGCTFDVAGAWLSQDGKVTPIDGAAYDYGGNHHNDSIEIPHAGGKLRYYHSSFGFGWRSCHPPDCLQSEDASGKLLKDGCTTDRTLPVTCVRIWDDGTETPLDAPFEKCPGDSNVR